MNKKYIPAAIIIVALCFAFWHSSTRWERLAMRIIKKECNCFDAANISLSYQSKYVLENSTNYVTNLDDRYYALTDQEKNELKKFAIRVYDPTTQLGSCLKKIKREEEEPLGGNSAMKKLDPQKIAISLKPSSCSYSYYYERGIIQTLWYMAMQDSIRLNKVIEDSTHLNK